MIFNLKISELQLITFRILISFVKTPFSISFKCCEFPKNKHISSAQAIKRNFSFIPTGSRATAVTAAATATTLSLPAYAQLFVFWLVGSTNKQRYNDMIRSRGRRAGYLNFGWGREPSDQRCEKRTNIKSMRVFGSQVGMQEDERVDFFLSLLFTFAVSMLFYCLFSINFIFCF